VEVNQVSLQTDTSIPTISSVSSFPSSESYNLIFLIATLISATSHLHYSCLESWHIRKEISIKLVSLYVEYLCKFVKKIHFYYKS
jgi:hypothetical protein